MRSAAASAGRVAPAAPLGSRGRLRAAPGRANPCTGPSHVEVRVEASGVEVPGGGHQDSRPVHDPLVALGATVVGIAGVVREGVLTAPARALSHVEDRVGAAVDHVHPHRPHRLHLLPGARVGGHEIGLVDHPDPGGHRGQVVDHVVEQQRVVAADRISVTARERHDRLLLAGREETLRKARRGVAAVEVQPHAVVQVDHVHARHLAVEVGQVGTDAREVPILLRLLEDDLVADLVLARLDVERADPVLDPLGPVGRILDGNGLARGHRLHRHGGGRGGEQRNERDREHAYNAPPGRQHHTYSIYLRTLCE